MWPFKLFVREEASVMSGNTLKRPHIYEMSVVGLPSPWPVVESVVAWCAVTSFWPYAKIRKSKRKATDKQPIVKFYTLTSA